MADETHNRTIGEGDIDNFAREIGIPPCPAILTNFSAEMNLPEPDTRKLAALIGSDIAISAALLNLVNSPFYGLRSKASNVHQALSIIGLRAGANLVTGLILRQAFPAGASPLMQRFWDKFKSASTATAVAARRIRGVDLSEAQTYILFRDCGVPVMIGKFADYAAIYDTFDHLTGINVLSREQTAYRYSHARVGYALARGWLLPEPFCRAILYHHDFATVAAGRKEVEPANGKLIAFGLLVDQIVSFRSGGGLCPDWESGEKFALGILGITPEEVIALAEEPADEES